MIVMSLTHNVDLYSYHVFVSVILIQITYPKIIKQSGIASHTNRGSVEAELVDCWSLVDWITHMLVGSRRPTRVFVCMGFARGQED